MVVVEPFRGATVEVELVGDPAALVVVVVELVEVVVELVVVVARTVVVVFSLTVVEVVGATVTAGTYTGAGVGAGLYSKYVTKRIMKTTIKAIVDFLTPIQPLPLVSNCRLNNMHCRRIRGDARRPEAFQGSGAQFPGNIKLFGRKGFCHHP